MLHTILALPNDVLRNALVPFLDLECLVGLDAATLCKQDRPRLLDTIFCGTLLPEPEIDYHPELVTWLRMRGMFVKCLNFLHDGACDDELLFAVPVLQRAMGFQLPEHSNITNTALQTVFASFHTLQHVQFTGCEVDDEAIEALANNHPNLLGFRAIRCEFISDYSMMLLAENCPQLSHVQLDECPYVSNKTVDALAEHCALVEFSVVGCVDIDTDSLVRLLKKCGPVLQSLDLSNIPELEGELFALAEHCPMVDHLYLNDCEDINEEALRAVLQACQELEALDMRGSKLGRETLECISTHISPALMDLRLYHCPEMTDELLVPLLERVEHLNALYLNDSPITNASLLALASLHPHLYELHLAGCVYLSLEGIRAFVRASTRLGMLVLSRCPLVCNECVVEIATHTRLASLGLVDCERLTLELGEYMQTEEEEE